MQVHGVLLLSFLLNLLVRLNQAWQRNLILKASQKWLGREVFYWLLLKVPLTAHQRLCTTQHLH